MPPFTLLSSSTTSSPTKLTQAEVQAIIDEVLKSEAEDKANAAQEAAQLKVAQETAAKKEARIVQLAAEKKTPNRKKSSISSTRR